MANDPTKTDQLISTAYDLALDPSLFERFATAWDRFVQDMSGEEKELDADLQAHFERAFLILERMGRDVNPSESLENLIEQRDGPCLSVNENGDVVVANAYANQLLGEQLANLSLPSAVHRKSSESLLRGLAEVQTSNGLVPILVLLEDNVPSLFVLRKLPQSTQILIDITGSVWSPEVGEFLRETHGLTDAEIEVAKLLYQGLNLQQIADSRHRSKETIRKHLGAVFDKTGCRSQAQLMRLITGVNFAPIEARKLAWFSKRISTRLFDLKDGRHLAYYRQGEDGYPVVVMHPYLRTPELPKKLERFLIEGGSHLIGVCRAGFGDSSPRENDPEAIKTSAQDVIELMDHLGFKQFSLLGLMGGSLNCYQIAKSFPERVKDITVISGTVPILNDQQVKSMPPSTRAMAFTARRFPKIFPFLIRSAVAMVDMGDEEKLIHAIYGKSPNDWEHAMQPATRKWIVRGAQFTVNHGYSTYANELAAVAKQDASLLDGISCPITLFHSPQDIFVTLESVHALANQHDNMQVVEIPDSSHLMLYSHTDSIIETMEHLN